MSLATRVCLLVAGLILAVATTFSALLWGAWQEESRAHVQSFGDAIARSAGPRLVDAVSRNDDPRAERMLSLLQAVPGLKWAELADASGQVRARVGVPRLQHTESSPGLFVEGDNFVIIRQINAPGSPTVTLRLGFDRTAIQAMRADSFGHVALIVLAMIALAAPITLLVVSRLMAPLQRLTDFAGSVTEADLGRQIDIRTGDELETLAQAFNTMTGRLDAALQRMRRLAYVDQVTELPNAERFQIDLTDVLESLSDKDSIAALTVVSLDRLQRLTDTLGQEAAQELLAVAAQRLAAAVRVADRSVRLAQATEKPSVAARISNAEFAVLAPSLASPADAARMAQIVSSALSQPIGWRGHRITFGCTVGAALLPRDGRDADTALRHARLAANAARGEHRPMRFFTRSLDSDAHARLTLEREMREAIERGEIRAYFQPKVNLLTGKITGAEALARWTRPDSSVVSPGVFIPAAEENGLIDAISDAILRDACWKAAAWARDGHDVSVAVNVSPLQFNDERLAQRILRVLEQSGLAHHLLHLEVTESVAMKNIERVTSLIEPLRSRGVQFAIDDFGTGHSSLASLSRLPFDHLKIDQQFIRGLSVDRHAPAIVETILAMAASLNFETVAEGVETEEQAAFLRLRGCLVGQGYLYGPALAPADFLALLQRNAEGVTLRDGAAA